MMIIMTTMITITRPIFIMTRTSIITSIMIKIMTTITVIVPDNAAGPGNERTFPAPFEFS